MMKPLRVTLPLDKAVARTLRAGDAVLLTGVIYSCRDAVHRRIAEMRAEGLPPPFPLRGAVFYYVGPTPARPGEVIGAAGPTTSGRMDSFTPELLDGGLAGMIGKGGRSAAVTEAIKRNEAVYFGAVGGLGALLSGFIVSAEVVAFPELGAEAVYRMEVKDFPVRVIIDSRGENLYETGPAEYLAFAAQPSPSA